VAAFPRIRPDIDRTDRIASFLPFPPFRARPSAASSSSSPSGRPAESGGGGKGSPPSYLPFAAIASIAG